MLHVWSADRMNRRFSGCLCRCRERIALKFSSATFLVNCTSWWTHHHTTNFLEFSSIVFQSQNCRFFVAYRGVNPLYKGLGLLK